MKKRVFTLLLAAGLLAVAALTALTFPAPAQTQTVYVQLATRRGRAGHGRRAARRLARRHPAAGHAGSGPARARRPPPRPPPPFRPRQSRLPRPPRLPPPAAAARSPSSDGGSAQERSSSGRRVQDKSDKSRDLTGDVKARAKHEISKAKRRGRRSPLRNPDGTPTLGEPGFTDVLPGPSTATGVPNFIIRKFRVPPFLLSIYQAAGIEYGVRWEILAAINEIETDYGRNLNVSSAGALGWMQFMPSTWKMYGVDANKDGRKDPYNPVDAIFAAARYLKAAGYEQDVRRSIFAYNHADWYVDSVLLRARLIAGVPADVIGSLTGLTEGRFPVFARARYADDIAEQQLMKRVKRGENAAQLVESNDSRRSIDIFAKKGAPVVAVNDGVIKKIGKSKKLGRYVVLQDVYGNRYTYAHLGQVSKVYPVPKADATPVARPQRPALCRQRVRPDARRARVGRPPARLLRQRQGEGPRRRRAGREGRRPPRRSRSACSRIPDLPGSREAGGLEQQLDSEARHSGKFETFKAYFSRPFGLDPSKVRLRPLRKGSHVIGGTILARVGQHRGRQGRAPRLLDPPRRPRRSDHRPEADPRRLEAARGHGDLPRLRPQRALRQGQRRRDVDRPDPAAAEAAAREARALRRAHRHLRGRPRGHPLRPDRPARAGDPGLPRRVRPPAHRHLPEERPRLLHELGQRLRALVRQRRGHRDGQRHPDPRPPGAGRDHRADGAPPDAAPGHDVPAPDHLPAQHSAGPRSRWPTTTTTSTWASSRCSARTRSSASRRSRCSSPASGPT